MSDDLLETRCALSLVNRKRRTQPWCEPLGRQDLMKIEMQKKHWSVQEIST